MKRMTALAFSVLATLMSFTVHAAWTLNEAETSATDGSWTLTVAADEINGVTGLKVTSVSMGESSDLDLSSFESDTGEKIIRFNRVFNYNKTLTSVDAPSVLRVENQCFIGVSTLTSAHLPAATYLGDECFTGCSSLTDVTFSDSITSIGSSCFYQTKISLSDPNWPCLETVGASAFGDGPVITGDVKVPLLTAVSSAFGGVAGIKSFYAPNATTFTVAAFGKCTGLTNVTIKGSATALANARNNFAWSGAAPGTFVWLGNEAPTEMPAKAIYCENIALFRLYVNADASSTVQAWKSYCGATAEQIATDDAYAFYQKIAGYDEVKDRLIGFLGTAKLGNWDKVTVSALNSNGPCWIVNTAEVEEEVTYHATIAAPEHAVVESVRADGYAVQPDAEGKYEMVSSAKVEITYRAEPGYQFAGNVSVYTVSNIPAAEAIGADACDKALAPVTYRTLTLSAASLAAGNIASVSLAMAEPYLCETNGDAIVYSVYDGVAFALTYASTKKFRFEGGAKTAVVDYADGLSADATVAATDLPPTTELICRWTISGTTISDGNWTFGCDVATVDGVTGLRIRAHVEGDGDLDLTRFREESGSEYDVISTVEWQVFPKATSRIVAPGIRRFASSCATGVNVYEIIATNAVYFDYAAFGNCKNLTNLVFSAGVKTIGTSAFGGCTALASLGGTDWPQLTMLAGGAFVNTKIAGDLRMPEVTDLQNVFGYTSINSIYAPKCEVFDYQTVYACKELTNIVIKGSANCFNTATMHQAMTSVGPVETMRYVGETAPSYLPQASIYSAITNTPMMLYANLKGETGRADWEKLCTATAAQIKDDPAFASIKLIPNYRQVRKSLVGFIGDVVTKKGEYVSVRSQQTPGEFTYSGNGPCWVIDADWKPKGFAVIVR